MGDESSTLPPSDAAAKIGYNHLILTQMFRHLPAKPLFRFKMVCTDWKTLISSTDWPELRQRKLISGLYMCKYANEPNPDLVYQFIRLDPDGKFTPSSKPTKRSLGYVDASVRILQSCNGLFLCSSANGTASDPTNSIYIINPLTKQFTELPRPRGSPVDGSIHCINLAVDFSKSLEYKVVALSHRSGQAASHRIQIEVYSSKTGTWEFSRVSSVIGSYEIDYRSGTYWKSAIHWPSFRLHKAPYYDVDKDSLLVMPMPPIQGGYRWRSFAYFGESNGRLLLIDYNRGKIGARFYIFEMKDDYSQWWAKYSVDLSDIECELPKYHRPMQVSEPGTDGVPPLDGINVLSVVCRDDNRQSFIVIYKNGICIAYYFNRLDCRKICNLPLSSGDLTELRINGRRAAHHYIETPFWV